MATPTTAGEWALTEFMRPERRSLGDTVVSALVERIVGGRLDAGTALPSELEIGDQLGVSRTVVRESLKRVQAKGLVASRQGVGTVVLPMSSWDLIDDVVLDALVRHDDSLAILDDLVNVRASLEMMMAEAAAHACLLHAEQPPPAASGGAKEPADAGRTVTALGSPARPPLSPAAHEMALNRIHAALAKMENHRDSIVDFAKADVEFHAAVMAMSGNLLGQAIVTSIHDKARTTGRYHGAPSNENIQLTLSEHERILAAILAGQAAQAGEEMRQHILGSWTRRRPDASDAS